MKILVIGGTGGIGRQTVDAALARGHTVRAMGRSAGALPRDVAGLEPSAGDALDSEDLGRALSGVDAVVQALGMKESVAMLWQEVALFSHATRVLLPAMREAEVSRLIAVTGFGAGASKQSMSAPERLVHGIVFGKPYADKDRQEEMLKASDLDWTIVRPTILTNSPATGRYRVLADPQTWRNGLISRADVAAFIVHELERGDHIQRDVVVTR